MKNKIKATAKNIAETAASKNILASTALFGLLACYQAGASVSRDYVSVFQKRAKTSARASGAAGAAHLQKQLKKDIARLASLFSGDDEAKARPAFEIQAQAKHLERALERSERSKRSTRSVGKDISRRFDFAAQKDFLLEKAKKLKPRLPSKQIARRNGQAQKGDFGAFRLSQRRIQ